MLGILGMKKLSEDSWGTTDDLEEEKTSTNEESALDLIFEEAYIPPAQGAVIQFENVDIKLLSSGDSVVTIKGTNASLLLDKNQMIGEGGTFDWTSAGLIRRS